MNRQPDECFKCGRAFPDDKLVNAPTKAGKPRACCLPCGMNLGGAVKYRLSYEDRRKIDAYTMRALLRYAPTRGLGVTPRMRRV